MGALAIALLSLAKVEDAATAMKIAGFFFIIYIYFQSLIFHCFFLPPSLFVASWSSCSSSLVSSSDGFGLVAWQEVEPVHSKRG